MKLQQRKQIKNNKSVKKLKRLCLFQLFQFMAREVFGLLFHMLEKDGYFMDHSTF